MQHLLTGPVQGHITDNRETQKERKRISKSKFAFRFRSLDLLVSRMRGWSSTAKLRVWPSAHLVLCQSLLCTDCLFKQESRLKLDTCHLLDCHSELVQDEKRVPTSNSYKSFAWWKGCLVKDQALRFDCWLLMVPCYCLRPLAKDQGITWVVLVLVLHHLVHFLLKIILSEKKFSLPGNQTRVLLLPRQALNQLSYSATDTIWLEFFFFNQRISKTTLQTLRQSWCNYLFFIIKEVTLACLW